MPHNKNMEAMIMFNNPYFPFTNYNRPAQTGYGVFPVSRIEEIQSFLPDYTGNPSFFFNNSQNEIYVKQFDQKTAMTNVRKYVLSKEPVKTQNKLEEEINTLRNEIQHLKSLVKPKEVKSSEVKDAE